MVGSIVIEEDGWSLSRVVGSIVVEEDGWSMTVGSMVMDGWRQAW